MTRFVKSQGQQAYILLWVLFLFMFLSLMALYFMDASIMEVLISSNHRRDVQAFAMADAGVSMGSEQIYAVLVRDYSSSQEIPGQINLDQQKWNFDGDHSELSFLLTFPQMVSRTEGECIYQFISQGDCAPARKKIQVKVRVQYTDFFVVYYREDGAVVLVFDHRDFHYPVRISTFTM